LSIAITLNFSGIVFAAALALAGVLVALRRARPALQNALRDGNQRGVVHIPLGRRRICPALTKRKTARQFIRGRAAFRCAGNAPVARCAVWLTPH
jgi:hypothetical protein